MHCSPWVVRSNSASHSPWVVRSNSASHSPWVVRSNSASHSPWVVRQVAFETQQNSLNTSRSKLKMKYCITFLACN
ncbi:hypothetical protein [Leptospira kirschneri]|uniref:hypothetical protein n=1 Tax=Leptospira kirschneri TaxID=29507 RepID=UPI0035698996